MHFIYSINYTFRLFYKYLIVINYVLFIFFELQSQQYEEKSHFFKIFDHERTGNTYEFSLKRRASDVFQNVSVWALNSKEIYFKGLLGEKDIVCEDIAMSASLIPIPDYKYKGGCEAEHFTGVFGTWEEQQSIIPYEIYKFVWINEEAEQYRFRRELSTSKPQTKILQVLENIKHNGEMHGYVKKGKQFSRNHEKSPLTSNREWKKLNVKILTVIDYALFKKLHENLAFIDKYMNIFWSSVELKYRQIQEIQIRIKVTGVIIVEEHNVLNYTDKHKFRWFMNSLDMDKALNNFGEIKAYVGQTNITDYNIIVTLTGLHGMVTTSDPFYYSNFVEVLGYAFTKGVCDPENNGVICEDDGNFSSLSVAVHEIAHSLGLRHDGDIRKFENDIDYSSCRTSDPGVHYAMATKYLHSFDEYIWSNCSKKYFEYLKRDKDMACIGER